MQRALRTQRNFVFLEECKMASARRIQSNPMLFHGLNAECFFKNKDPANRDRVSKFNQGKVESGSVRLFRLGDGLSLGAFLSLHDFKFNVITFLKAFISFRLDGAIVNKNIGAIFPANKAEALCIVKPFHFTFNSRHVPYSIWPHSVRSYRTPGTILSDFSTGILPPLKEGRRMPEVTCLLPSTS